MTDFLLYSLAFGGLLVFFAGVIVVCFMCWVVVSDRPEVDRSSSYVQGYEDARARLESDAWWFSESPETTELLQDIAKGVSLWDARDKWRKARSEQTEALP